MNMPGPLEVVVILVVALLVFGPEQMKVFAKGMGQALREFKKAISNVDEEK